MAEINVIEDLKNVIISINYFFRDYKLMQVTYNLEMLLFLLFVDQAILAIGLPILILECLLLRFLPMQSS